MPRRAARLASATVAATLASASLASGSPASPAYEVVGGSLASLTGSGQPYGTSQARGASLAARDSASKGGVRVRLRLADDQSSAVMGTNQVIAFTGARVGAVLGPTLSGVAAAADPVAAAAGIPVLAVTNTTLDLTQAGRTVWRVSLSENRLIPASVTYARTRRAIRSGAIVSVTGDAYSEGAAAAFRAAAASHGITVSAEVSMPTGSSDAAARALIAEARAGAPDALFFAARSTDAVRLAVAATGFPGVKVGGNGYNPPDVLGAAGASTDGMIVSASWNPHRRDAASRTFVRAYRARFGSVPDAFAAQGYAGVQLLEAAAARGRGGTPERVLNGLRAVRAVPSVLGTMRFTPGAREAVYPATVQQVRGGRLLLAP
jgi:branched-chain amino acid transport system substrate-binding protein